jgi:opacity protein-like surface antigen
MRGLFLLLGFAAAAAAGPAAAQSEPGLQRNSLYFGPNLNLTWLRLIPSGGSTAREAVGVVGIGYDFGSGFTVQIAGWSSEPAADPAYSLARGGFASTMLIVRALYAFTGYATFSPYIGGVLGVADGNQRILGMQNNDWVASYELRSGVNYTLSQKLFGSAEYLKREEDKPVAGVSPKFQFPSRGFLAGMNYKFY